MKIVLHQTLPEVDLVEFKLSFLYGCIVVFFFIGFVEQSCQNIKLLPSSCSSFFEASRSLYQVKVHR